MVDLFPGEFFINGISAFNEFKTIIQERPDIMAPKRKMNAVSPYAFNGAVYQDEHAYENTEITLNLAILAHEEERALYRRKLFYALSTGGYVDIEFYFDPGVIYRCALVENYSYANKYFYDGVQTTEVKLSVAPYKTKKSNDIVLISDYTKLTENIEAPGQFFTSFPTFKVTGSGEVYITATSGDITQRYNLVNLTNDTPIVIDNDMKFVYGLTYESRYTTSVEINANLKMKTREFMRIPGSYRITTSGNISELSVTPNWRILV